MIHPMAMTVRADGKSFLDSMFIHVITSVYHLSDGSFKLLPFDGYAFACASPFVLNANT